jgi:O-methyltransferase involved in polyketide biosynthesis
MKHQSAVRTSFFDAALSRHLTGIGQLVILGAGFDPGRPSFFLWESVTMYLDRESVEGTLRVVAAGAPGSVVAFDYVSAELMEARTLFMRYARAMLNAAGKPWSFGIDNTPPVRERLAELLASCGLVLEEQRDFGRETDRRHAMAGFAVGIVAPK